MGASATAAKGGIARRAAASATFAGAILGPVVGILGGWLGYKLNMDNAESARERQFLAKSFGLWRCSWACFAWQSQPFVT